MTRRLSPSLEDYLEAVYSLSRENGFARACAVSRRLKVAKPSVSSAVKALAARGLLEQERYGGIRLSPAGEKLGAEISSRHSTLKDFFISVLRMPPETAERDACRAEHALSLETLSRISALAAFLKSPAGRKALSPAGLLPRPGRKK